MEKASGMVRCASGREISAQRQERTTAAIVSSPRTPASGAQACGRARAAACDSGAQRDQIRSSSTQAGGGLRRKAKPGPAATRARAPLRQWCFQLPLDNPEVVGLAEALAHAAPAGLAQEPAQLGLCQKASDGGGAGGLG